MSLLETKLHAPRRTRRVVARPRLDDRVRGAGGAKLVLVSAPAGFGKTTAMSEWLAAVDGVAWLSLDARDNDPAVFWSYVVAALRTVAGDVGAVEGDVTALLNDLARHDGEVVLVLDDYHVVESPEIHESMVFLLEHLPAQVQVVVTTRADPPFPLATMRARGELVELRATDLRFTADEAAAYLNDAMGLALTAADVATLEARTEGWIAALQLAALSMQGRADPAGFIAGFAGDDRYVVDYLVGEVLDRQTDEVRDFLLATSILSRLTGGLCDAVTGRPGGKAMLEELERANLLLVPLDDRRDWYRYHHLFADVLRARLLDDRPDAVADLHRRASEWFDQHGEPRDAIRHALEGRDFDAAADLIERAATATFDARQEATVRGWLDALPDDVIRRRPVLQLAVVGARMSMGEFDGVPALLDLLESPQGDVIVVDEAEHARLPARVAMYRAALALVGGDITGTITHARHAQDLADPDDLIGHGGPAALLGLAHWSLGDLDTAREHYADAVAVFARSTRLTDVLGCSLALADIELAQGDLVDAEQTLEAGLVHAERHGVVRGTADMHVGLAEILIERGELDAARHHLEIAEAGGDAAGLPQNAYRRRVARANLLQAEGDLPAALALLDEAEPIQDTDFSPDVRPIPARKARVQLALGDVDAARRWARGRGLAADDELSYMAEYEHVTLAQLLLAEGQRAEAAPLLDRLVAAAEAGGRRATVAEILALQGRPAAPPPRGPQGLVDPLSERELDVLRLLRSELSGPEIAGELMVSLNTLRTHTKNIYAKLGVNSRRQAVRRADEIGL